MKKTNNNDTPSYSKDSPSILWHDYETFGISPKFDKPSQFAGIRTDENLNEIDEPVQFFCRPSPDYLPHPQALMITGITPQQCLQDGERAVAAAALDRIHSYYKV